MQKIAIILIFLFPLLAMSQISEGGFPYSFDHNIKQGHPARIELPAPDLPADEKQKEGTPVPYQVGVGIETSIDLMKEGTQSLERGGMQVCRLSLYSENAKGLVLYYRHFSIPEGGRLFLYSSDRQELIGAFTSRNNPSGGYFATEMIKGDELVLEYNAPAGLSEKARIEIYQVHYVFRDVEPWLKGLSGPCEVNVNCPEGAEWQNQKRSVAKIVLKAGLGTYLCTGTLVNNTRQDSTPYFLTARHCGSTASLTDYSQWMFHFNYESITCEDPPENPSANIITGSELLAQAPDGTNIGSDFKLLLLDQQIPEEYNPYFSGWDRSGTASPSGVCIHHPKGDIKKISTYTSSLVSVNYGETAPSPEGLYWKVNWVETANGHGVTEGGSSGSPIFSEQGRIVGTLTGGAASCNDPTAPDYYGKFSYHWESNGSPGGAQLRPYLDPEGTGQQSMDGFGYGSQLEAYFRADTTVISAGSRISFTDLSLGNPESWEWTFSGASPLRFTGQNPGGIAYNEYGSYDVSLVITEGNLKDSITRQNYIRVTPRVYPNPAREHVIIDLGHRSVEFIEVKLFDINGQMARAYKASDVTGIFRIPLSDVNTGQYVLRITTNLQEDHVPVVVY